MEVTKSAIIKVLEDIPAPLRIETVVLLCQDAFGYEKWPECSNHIMSALKMREIVFDSRQRLISGKQIPQNVKDAFQEEKEREERERETSC